MRSTEGTEGAGFCLEVFGLFIEQIVDTIYYELQHAITTVLFDYENPRWSDNYRTAEFRALHEAWSDYFAYAQNSHPLLFEWSMYTLFMQPRNISKLFDIF